MSSVPRSTLYEANNLNNFSRGNNLSLTYQLGANWEIVKDLRLRASFTYDRMESMTEKYVSPFSSAITDGLENNSVEQLYRRGSYDKAEHDDIEILRHGQPLLPEKFPDGTPCRPYSAARSKRTTPKATAIR